MTRDLSLPQDFVVVASDNHLQLYSHKSRREIYGDALESWKYLIDYCVTNQPECLILPGDIFDDVTPIDVVIRAYVDGIRRLELADIPVRYIRGQHDMYGVDDPAAKAVMGERLGLEQFAGNLPSISSWANYMHRKSAFLLGRNWYFMDWLPADQVVKGLQEVPAGTDVLVTHQVFKEFSRSGNGSFSDVSHAKVVITGDKHEHKQVCYRGREDQMLLVMSPGSASPQAISEEGPFEFYVVSAGPMEPNTFVACGLEARSVPYPMRPVGRVRVDKDLGMLEWDGLARYLDEQEASASERGALAIPIVDVVVKDPAPDLYARLEALTANGKAHLFWRAHSAEEQTEESNSNSTVESVQQAAQAWVLEKGGEDPSLVRSACRLWDSADPAAEATLIYSELMAPIQR